MNAHAHREQLKGWLELLVLSLLHHEPTCGYRLRQLAIDQSNHEFAPALGRLYPLLADLKKCGLLSVHRETEGKRTRNIYTLTKKGEERRQLLKDRWAAFSKAMTYIAKR